jgi:hypothetical protein
MKLTFLRISKNDGFFEKNWTLKSTFKTLILNFYSC